VAEKRFSPAAALNPDMCRLNIKEEEEVWNYYLSDASIDSKALKEFIIRYKAMQPVLNALLRKVGEIIGKAGISVTAVEKSLAMSDIEVITFEYYRSCQPNISNIISGSI
jgi:transcription antitermination factor NusA-like protein